MRKRLAASIGVALVTALIMHPSSADAACRDLQDSKARLKCYDSENPPSNAPPPPEAVSVRDFILDANELAGKRVSVRGSIGCLTMQACFLYPEEEVSLQGASFNAEKLARQDRARILGCQPFAQPCVAVVTGIAHLQLGNPSIEAQSIAW